MRARRSFLYATLLSIGFFLPTAFAQQPPPLLLRSVPNLLAEFPISRRSDCILVPVRIAGRTFPFQVDTGCSFTICDTTLRPLLGPWVGGTSFRAHAGNGWIDFFAAPPAWLGPLPLRCPWVALYDFQTIRRVSRQPIYGLLGMNFLRQHVLHIDFERGRLAFLHVPPPVPGQAVPMRVGGLTPEIPVSLAGVADLIGFTADTGNAGSATATPMLLNALLGSGHAWQERWSWYVDVTGLHVCRPARLAAAAVGGFVHWYVAADPSQVNTLGMEFWQHYVVTFDFPRGRLFLKPRPVQGSPWVDSGRSSA